MRPPLQTLKVLPLLVEQVSALGLAPVDTTVGIDTPSRLPVILVETSQSGVVPNGEPSWSASFTATLTAVAAQRMESHDLAHRALDGLLASWRKGLRTTHGWISHMRVVALPYPSSTPGAHGLWSYTAVIDVVARH